MLQCRPFAKCIFPVISSSLTRNFRIHCMKPLQGEKKALKQGFDLYKRVIAIETFKHSSITKKQLHTAAFPKRLDVFSKINNEEKMLKIVPSTAAFARSISGTPIDFSNVHYEVKVQLDTNSPSEEEQEIIGLTQQLITVITKGDYETYTELCDKNISSFEPEARGNLVEGLDFHKYYFDNLLKNRSSPINTTLLSPRVMMLSENSACITYIRLTQKIISGEPVSSHAEETRVWQRKGTKWVCVHFHRSEV